MASNFSVDLGELNSLVTNLESAKESMTSANNALKDTSAKDLGSAALDSAGKDFEDKWEYGIGKLADLAGKMTGGLRDTQKDYAQAEAAIKKMFPDVGGAASGGAAAATADSGSSRIGNVLGGGANAASKA